MSTNEFLTNLLTQYKQTEINQVAKLPTNLQKNGLFAIKGLLISILQTIYPDIELYLELDSYANIVVLQMIGGFLNRINDITMREQYSLFVPTKFIFYTNYNFEILINLQNGFVDADGLGNIQFIQYDKPVIDNIITAFINLGGRQGGPYIRLNQKDAWISGPLPFEFDRSNYTFNFNVNHEAFKDEISTKFKDILDGSKPFIHPKIYIDFLHFNNDNAQIMQYANLNNCDNLVGQIADFCKNTNVELTQPLSRAGLKARQKRNCIAPIESHKYRAGGTNIRNQRRKRKTFKNKYSK